MSKYEKRITVGFAADGSRIRKRVYSNSKAGLDREIAAALQEAQETAPENITFGKFAEKWLEAFCSRQVISTQKSYRYTVGHMEKLFPLLLKNIKKSDLQDVINENWEHYRTCQEIRRVAKAMFAYAVEDDYIKKSPANNLQVPKARESKRRAFTEQEREALKSLVLAPMQQLFVEIMYATGLRPGECIALMKKDFYPDHVLIDKAISYDSNRPYIKSTKTGVTRKVPITKDLYRMVMDYDTGNSLYLFHTKEGGLMTKQSYKRMVEAIFKALNEALGGNDQISKCADLTAYCFRHDFATRLYYVQGISTKKKAAIMGHSELMFMKIYSHLEEENENISELLKVSDL